MAEATLNHPVMIGLTGAVIALAMCVKLLLARTPVPNLVGFLALGVLLRLVDSWTGIFTAQRMEVIAFLAKTGLVVLLFRIGLESDLGGLLRQLRRASGVWAVDVALSGAVGFAAAYFVLGLAAAAAAVVAAAFTATSVGLSVAVWERRGALKSPNGELLIDVAELDDVSAVVMMAVLFALLPKMRETPQLGALIPAAASTLGVLAVKLVLFSGGCFLFSRYVERRLTRFFCRSCDPPEPMLGMVAVAFLIAALAAILGFSMAIGGFFAGLVFSRDSAAVKMETSFEPLDHLFSPFFFIGIGLEIHPGSLVSAAGMGTVLLAAAVVGKALADGLPVWRMAGLESGLLIGMSMVPRAEIAMAIMQRGLKLGEVPPSVYGGMVVVSALTCFIGPVAVDRMLKQWPQGEDSP